MKREKNGGGIYCEKCKKKNSYSCDNGSDDGNAL